MLNLPNLVYVSVFQLYHFWTYCNLFFVTIYFISTVCCLFFQASAHQKNLDVGANVFIGNLDPEVDEKLLYDTFSAFGVILQTPKVYFNCNVTYVLCTMIVSFSCKFIIQF